MTVAGRINVLLIEDQSLTRIGIKTVLADIEGMDVVADTDDPARGFMLFAELQPDVTILGLRFPDSCTIDDLDNYFLKDPKAKIIVLADHAGDSEISRALKKGALGYVCKDVEPDELVKAIRTVAAGRRVYSGRYCRDPERTCRTGGADPDRVQRADDDRRRNVEQRDRICPRHIRKHCKDARSEYIWQDRSIRPDVGSHDSYKTWAGKSRSMNDEMIKYAEELTSGESEVLQELRAHCYAHYEDSNMLSGFFQGRVLSMLSHMIRPKVVLEIGTYLGYSALCLAEGLACTVR